MQDALLAGGGECERTLGRGDGLIIRPSIAEVDGQKARDLAEAPWSSRAAARASASRR